MAPKRPRPTTPPRTHPLPPTFTGRNGLGAYTFSPSSFPASRVISHDENWVVIHDLYPKSSVHILLLPRTPSKILLHPFDALADPVFLAAVQAKVRELRLLVAKELRRRYGERSALERARLEALDAWPAPTTLPPGRDWEREAVAGVHAVPSMSHLHVHVLSVDRASECMRHRKHYNSFNTPFLVGVEDFPLAAGDERRRPGRQGYLDRGLECWRCGERFGNRFARLKRHLAEEFEEWVQE